MNFKSIVLLLAAAGVGAIGLGYLIAPHFMFGLYGIRLDSVNELNMVRSAYGGLFLAFALLFLVGMIHARFARPALVALFVFMAGFASGRIVSLVVDGIPDALVLGLIVVETMSAAAAAFLLSRETGEG